MEFQPSREAGISQWPHKSTENLYYGKDYEGENIQTMDAWPCQEFQGKRLWTETPNSINELRKRGEGLSSRELESDVINHAAEGACRERKAGTGSLGWRQQLG